MIELQYLGSLKKELSADQENLQWQAGLTSVGGLIDHLCNERGALWGEILRQEKLLISVNQKMVKSDCPLSDGDKVIFFPPIAGG